VPKQGAHPPDTRPVISVVDQHASQFRKRAEECQQRLSAWRDLRCKPVRWVNGDGAVSAQGCACFCGLATFLEGFHAAVEADDDSVAMTGGDSMVEVRFVVLCQMHPACNNEEDKKQRMATW
jgi:hypothetical protein